MTKAQCAWSQDMEVSPQLQQHRIPPQQRPTFRRSWEGSAWGGFMLLCGLGVKGLIFIIFPRQVNLNQRKLNTPITRNPCIPNRTCERRGATWVNQTLTWKLEICHLTFEIQLILTISGGCLCSQCYRQARWLTADQQKEFLDCWCKKKKTSFLLLRTFVFYHIHFKVKENEHERTRGRLLKGSTVGAFLLVTKKKGLLIRQHATWPWYDIWTGTACHLRVKATKRSTSIMSEG